MTTQPRSTLVPMIIIGSLFFIFGFVTWLNGPLIMFVKLAFQLDTDSKAFLVTTAFFLAYFFLAIPSSMILEKTGMKKGMAIGLSVMALGTFMFGTFATQRNYPLSLAGLFIVGSGLSLLQTACNPYISIIGSIESAAQRISIMGICNKLAGMASPMVMGWLVMDKIGPFEEKMKAATDVAVREALLNDFAGKIYVPYMVMAGLLVLLALWILKSPLPEINPAEVNKAPEDSALSTGRTNVFQFPYTLLGALCIFVYVGAEVMAGDAIGVYGKGFNIPSVEAMFFTKFTLRAMLVGYIAGLFTIPRFISQQTALRISAILGVLFTIGAFFTHGYTSVYFVAALGFANAMMWPAIFPLAIAGLGRFTEKGSALLIMGIVGGALIPQLFAGLKEHYNFQAVFTFLMIPCYLYILFYSIKGHKILKW